MLAPRKLPKNFRNAAQLLSAYARQFSSQNPSPRTQTVPSSGHYDELINVAGRNRDFDSVRKLLIKRIADGCHNTSNTFEFIAADGSVLNDLLRNLSAIDNWFARKHAHDSLVAQLSKLNRISQSLRVAMTMVKRKYGATPVTFRPIINALARENDTEAARRVIEVMRVSDIKPDLAAYNYILTAYCFLGDVTSAADVLVKMEEEGLRADARTYDALVLGACRAGCIGGALAVMRRMMEDGGVKVLYSSHSHIIKEMVVGDYPALEYVRIFSGKDEKLDKDNIGFLARRLRMMKKIREAKCVVAEMEKMGLSIDDELMELRGTIEHVI